MGLRYSLLKWAVMVMACASGALAQDVCNPVELYGAYGFQLAGTTTIAGPRKPIAVVGRFVLGEAGNLSGVSSVNFNGLFLGNPVTGKYEAKSDCSVTLSLQDTSGAFQSFSGKMRPGGGRVEVHQTGAGAGGQGLLVRASDRCDVAAFQGNYDMQISGTGTPFVTGSAPKPVNASIESQGNGNVILSRGEIRTNGSYTIDSDCVMQFDLALPEAEGALVKLRGILSNGGREVLVVGTDPQRVASGRFLAK